MYIHRVNQLVVIDTMKKKKTIGIAVLVFITIYGLLLFLNLSNEKSNQVDKTEATSNTEVSSIKENTEKFADTDVSGVASQNEITSSIPKAPETQVEPTIAPAVAEVSSIIIEEALLQREITKAEIAATYSRTGDGILSEADMRRYAEERYMKRRDLNGNGRLDGYELRAITQHESSEGATADLNPNLSRGR